MIYKCKVILLKIFKLNMSQILKIELRWREGPTRRWEVHLTATRRKNVTCGTVDPASCKTADSSASNDEFSVLLCGIRISI